MDAPVTVAEEVVEAVEPVLVASVVVVAKARRRGRSAVAVGDVAVGVVCAGMLAKTRVRRAMPVALLVVDVGEGRVSVATGSSVAVAEDADVVQLGVPGTS